MTAVPELSVIIALQDVRATVRDCIDSLLAQTSLDRDAVEIILVDGSRDGTGLVVAQRYPHLCLLRASGSVSLPRLCGVGIARARGRLVAITEGHCVFAPTWAASAIAAHRRSASPAIGGAVEPAPTLGPLNRALYYCDYGSFLRPLADGPAHDLPGNNVVFTREAIARAGDTAATGFWKTFFCRALQQEGATLLMDSSLIVVYHRRLSLVCLIRRRYDHGRCWGAMRAERSGTASRVFYGMAAPLMPWILTYRLIRCLWPKRQVRQSLVRLLPLCWLIFAIWIVGEWTGNWFGAGTSCERL